MRTKTLFCLAALTAAGVATSMAQSNVYSLNVVGYYNVTCPANTSILLGNQLAVTAGGVNDTLTNVIPSSQPGAQFFKFSPGGGFSAYTWDDIDLAWTGNTSLRPGEGGFYKSPVNTTLTFVGEVTQGKTTNLFALTGNRKAILASIVPQSIDIPTMNLPGEPGDQYFQYRGGYSVATFDDLDLVWAPFVPVPNVGEAFFYSKASGSVSNQWVRNFTVQ